MSGIQTYRNSKNNPERRNRSFEIHLIPDSEGEEKIIEDVYVDMLVSVIDENVEKRKTMKNGFLKNIIL